jgi:hypothetical protein
MKQLAIILFVIAGLLAAASVLLASHHSVPVHHKSGVVTIPGQSFRNIGYVNRDWPFTDPRLTREFAGDPVVQVPRP